MLYKLTFCNSSREHDGLTAGWNVVSSQRNPIRIVFDLSPSLSSSWKQEISCARVTMADDCRLHFLFISENLAVRKTSEDEVDWSFWENRQVISDRIVSRANLWAVMQILFSRRREKKLEVNDERNRLNSDFRKLRSSCFKTTLRQCQVNWPSLVTVLTASSCVLRIISKNAIASCQALSSFGQHFFFLLIAASYSCLSLALHNTKSLF